jgi:hypothetical protein
MRYLATSPLFIVSASLLCFEFGTKFRVIGPNDTIVVL